MSVSSKDADTHVIQRYGHTRQCTHQTWVILAAGAAHELFVLRLIFRQECHDDVDTTIFHEALVTTHEVRAAAVGPCHERDLVATDCLYMQLLQAVPILFYSIMLY